MSLHKVLFVVSLWNPLVQMRLIKDVATPYIIGGWDVTPGSFPWVVSITYFGSPFCGGTILNQNYVLTAAHCIRYFSRGYRITAGEHSLATNEGTEQRREVLEVKIHPGFDILNLQNDIGLIKVNEPFRFNEFVQPAIVANASYIPLSSEITAVGWGLEKEKNQRVSDELLQVKIFMLPAEQCKFKLDNLRGIIYNAGVFCAGGLTGRGTCFGDSGSPVHSAGVVYGLASATAVCARQDFPAVYTKVAYFSSWIQSRIAPT